MNNRDQIAIIVLCLCIFAKSQSQENSSVFLQQDILGMKTEGIAFLGSGMNEDDAKTFAINDAKRNALEQAGTYLESHTTVLNYKLVKDEVITFSAGLLKVKVLSEERTTINNMFAFKVKILAAIDTKILNNRIAEIQKDSGLCRQLKAEREKVKQLETRIVNLQAPSSTASKQTVKNVLNELSAVDWANKGFNIKDIREKAFLECKNPEIIKYLISKKPFDKLSAETVEEYNKEVKKNTKLKKESKK
jgi:hypothetical protein